VRDSAKSARAIEYARRHGLEIDDRMAVMVQEWIRDPLVSGVGYSDTDPDNPKIMLEFVERETSERMMSGDQQGVIVSCDVDSHVQHVGGAWSASLGASGLDKVAVVVKGLEEDFGERLDVEFIVAKDKRIYVIQARSVTDPDWPGVQIPEVEESRIILESNIVRGAGVFTGPAFVLQPGFLFQVGQHLELRDFNKNHPEGYCLIAENLKGHEAMLENNGLSNMRALVTVDYASRFSHPIKVVSETGAFYLGVLGRRDILRTVITGDTLTVTADQSSGLIYDHVVPALEPVTPVVERYLIDLADVTKISFQTGLKMQNPPYEEVDENLFVAGDGEIGVLFDDYNENETNGAPEKVYYRFIDMSGFVIGSGVYDIDTSDRMLKFDNFPALLKYLLYLARIKKTSQS